MLWFTNKKNKELEDILLSLHANASNNYKDNAQRNYKEFLQLYDQLKADGKLKAKQITYYEEVMKELAVSMKNYSHFEQRPDIQGLSELQNRK